MGSDGIDLAVEGVVSVPGTRRLSFELTWEPSRDPSEQVDMDIGCFYWAHDGSRGAVQSVTSPESSSTPSRAMLVNGKPLLAIGRDEVAGGTAGEVLVLERTNSIRFMVVHVSIYSGAADFRSAGARIAVHTDADTLAYADLNSRSPGLHWCAAMILGAEGRKLFLVNEERYFQSAHHADRHYGLGTDWVLGRKG
jgi:uncharacterized protein involved in tellurium resistance